MLASSLERILAELPDDAAVLDVGGWAKPLARADVVLDLMPYETRGMLGALGPGPERFSAETWFVRDICDREPFPFADAAFDFAVCSHTLEDIRDPIWVCAELSRVARAGYVEVPSRLEEQSFGVNGPWVGWSHHRWLIDLVDGELEFVAKPGVLSGPGEGVIPAEAHAALSDRERVHALFWTGEVRARERFIFDADELDDYLAAPARQVGAPRTRDGVGRRARRRLARLAGR